MPTYRISYRQSEYRHCFVDGDNAAAAAVAFANGADRVGDDFDYAEGELIIGIDEY
jgi:hypothetical protein